MKKETWKFIIQTVIAILTAIATSLLHIVLIALFALKRHGVGLQNIARNLHCMIHTRDNNAVAFLQLNIFIASRMS